MARAWEEGRRLLGVTSFGVAPGFMACIRSAAPVVAETWGGLWGLTGLTAHIHPLPRRLSVFSA